VQQHIDGSWHICLVLGADADKTLPEALLMLTEVCGLFNLLAPVLFF